MNGDTAIYKQIHSDCERFVRKAAAILSRDEHHQTVVRMKDEVDLATSADIEAEKFYIDAITRKYPDHGIYSEEAGEVTDVRDYVWIIDPLDGTKEFARGGKEYNTLLAVEKTGELVACATYRNGVNTIYSAYKGGGATRNGEQIHVSEITEVSKAFIGFHVPTRFNPEEFIARGMNVLNCLVRTAYRVRPGWDDSHYAAWVAKGLIDAHVISANVNRWYDVAPGILLVREAGGRVTDWDGNELTNHNLSHGLVLSNGHIHNELLACIKKAG